MRIPLRVPRRERCAARCCRCGRSAPSGESLAGLRLPRLRLLSLDSLTRGMDKPVTLPPFGPASPPQQPADSAPPNSAAVPLPAAAAASPRTRTTVACVRCRRGKTKCLTFEGKSACEACATRGVECERADSRAKASGASEVGSAPSLGGMDRAINSCYDLLSRRTAVSDRQRGAQRTTSSQRPSPLRTLPLDLPCPLAQSSQLARLRQETLLRPRRVDRRQRVGREAFPSGRERPPSTKPSCRRPTSSSRRARVRTPSL